MKIFTVPNHNWAKLEKSLVRLNKQLVKANHPAITWKAIQEISIPDPDQPQGAAIPCRVYEVEGAEPVVNGWHFVARLIHTKEGNIVRAVPGFEVSHLFRNTAPICEHCNQKRQRRDTYIVQHEDGRQKQVGSSCLRDFLSADPKAVCRATDLFLEAFDLFKSSTNIHWLGGGGMRQPYSIFTLDYLAYVAAVVRVEGRYVTRRMAQDSGRTSTSDVAYNSMLCGGQKDNVQTDRYQPTDEDHKMAETAVNYVRASFEQYVEADDLDGMFDAIVNGGDRRRDLNDFEHNLVSVASAQSIELRLTGIAAYVIEYYRREVLKPKSQVTKLNEQGMQRILEIFKTANTNLKWPKIRLADADGRRLTLSLAGEKSQNAGFIYVKRGEDYFGKISPQGRFFSTRSCPDTVETQLLAFAADPEGVASSFGRLTGCCCFCGQTLSDDRSTEVGYGPVCAKSYGLRWGSRGGHVHTETAPAESAA